MIEHRFPSGAVLALLQGDLTQARLAAIVNAANPHLQHAGGLAAAIASRGGPTIQRESDAWVREHGPARFDRPALTGAGDLPCGAVIHAVGPVWGEGDEDRKLAVAVRACLELASDRGFSSVGLPAISTGIYGFPVDRAAPITIDAIAGYLTSAPDARVKRVELILFDRPTLEVFLQTFRLRFPQSNAGPTPPAGRDR